MLEVDATIISPAGQLEPSSTPAQLLAGIEERCLWLSDLPIPRLYGSLVYDRYELFSDEYGISIRDLRTDRDFFVKDSRWAYVSPNRELIAFEMIGDTTLVTDKFAHVLQSIPQSRYAGIPVNGWINNETLGLAIYPNNSLRIWNWHDREYQELSRGEFRDFASIDPQWTFAVNSDLSLFAYSSQENGTTSLVVWDDVLKTEIARILYPSRTLPPIWSPDGGRLLFSAELNDSTPDFQSGDLFFVTKDGEINRLTQFEDSLAFLQYAPAWSPSGEAVAFLFRSSLDQLEDVGVVEVAKQNVVRYCTGSFGQFLGPPPIWSPDGQYIIIHLQSNGFRPFLVNVDSGETWPLLEEGATVHGWVAGE
ncbi:MAG: PD40 domain-containing protein [Anaerolineales bacterium]|nr:PD40 domain-containing protein [Anaerolineales bacterium]